MVLKQCTLVSLYGLQTVLEKKRGGKVEIMGDYTKEELPLYAEKRTEVDLYSCHGYSVVHSADYPRDYFVSTTIGNFPPKSRC